MPFRMNPIVLEFRIERETKGTYRYQEVEQSGVDETVGSLYVKAALGGPPRARLRVTIEASG